MQCVFTVQIQAQAFQKSITQSELTQERASTTRDGAERIFSFLETDLRQEKFQREKVSCGKVSLERDGGIRVKTQFLFGGDGQHL